MTSRITQIAPDTVAAVARIHLGAFPDSEGAGFGYRYAHAFISWFSHQADAIALAAWVDGVPRGYVVGAPTTRQPQLYRHMLPRAVQCALACPWTMLRRDVRAMARVRLRTIMRRDAARALEPEAAAATLVLNALAVAGDHRRRGVGHELLAAFEAEAAARQTRTLILSVQRNNDVARRLYESHRWRPFAEENRARLYYHLILGDTVPAHEVAALP